MLKEILSGDSCAACRVCCVFDREDSWEMPLIASELMKAIEKETPGVKIAKTAGGYGIFEVDYGEDGLARCPMLTEKGCRLGERKPFDCRIWPFRVMRKGNMLLLTLSPVCETVSGLPVTKISEFASKNADKIFEEARKSPETVKSYIDGYPVFAVREV